MLYLSREEYEQAAQAFAHAATVAEDLARKIGNDELRSLFLAAPQVQHIFMCRER